MATIILRTVKGVPLSHAEGDSNFSNLNDEKIERDGSIPMTGRFVLAAGDAGEASINIPAASADPDTPNAGDIWFREGRIHVRTASETVELAYTDDGANGFTGSQGFTGSAGTAGSHGTPGASGFTGSAGTAGANGFTGSRGTLPVTISTSTPSGGGQTGDLWAQVDA